MTGIHEAYRARQQARWSRPDATRWVRPDATRFIPFGARLQAWFPALARKYNPNQPRVPAGSGRESGQWADGGGGNTPVRLAQIGSSVTDADGLPYYDHGGHHDLPRGVYNKWDLSPEARRVFNRSTTGTLPPGILVEGPEGKLRGHYWNEAHENYNNAVHELGETFMREKGLTPKTMSADDAKELLRAIRESDDPRIRDFNRNIRMLRRIWRGGFRGRE